MGQQPSVLQPTATPPVRAVPLGKHLAMLRCVPWQGGNGAAGAAAAPAASPPAHAHAPASPQPYYNYDYTQPSPRGQAQAAQAQAAQQLQRSPVTGTPQAQYAAPQLAGQVTPTGSQLGAMASPGGEGAQQGMRRTRCGLEPLWQA